MNILIENLGPMKRAKFDIGDLTIICGGNNTGKTYATYATYGFLDYIHTAAQFPVDKAIVNRLLSRGSAVIPLAEYRDNLPQHIARLSRQYSKILPDVFASSESRFKETNFRFKLNGKDLKKFSPVHIVLGSATTELLQVKSAQSNNALEIGLIVDKSSDEVPPRELITNMISDGIRHAIFNSYIPRPFIASSERTGAAVFNRELDFTKNRIL